MQSKKHLMNLPSFWAALLTPITCSLVVVVTMFLNGLPSSCWSYGCFNNAFEILKVPLAILALIFPAVALVASHHRSVQTAEQIKLTGSKNNFENYINHQKYFSNFVDEKSVNDFNHIYVKRKSKLYSDIFIRNTILVFIPYENEQNILDKVSNKLKKLDGYFSTKNYNPMKDREVYNELKEISFMLNINKISFNFPEKEISIEFDEHDKYHPKTSLLRIRNSIGIFINELYKFSSNKEFISFEILDEDEDEDESLS